MNKIEIGNLYFKYDENSSLVIDNLNLAVEKGEFIAVLGHNGSGKSTLAKLINALLTPTQGKVLVITGEDSNLKKMDTQDKKEVFNIRKTVGLVFQNPDNQMVASIVEDDIAFGPENIGVKREEIKERIDFAMQATDIVEFKDRTISKLSGGQKQRVAIAGMLAIKPEILILDESTAMLDPKGRKEVMDVAKKLNKENNMTVIIITHYMEEAVDADRVIVLSNGRITANGSPKVVFEDEVTLKDAGLNLPRPTSLARELNRSGIPINPNILTREQLAEELCKLFAKI